MKKHGHYCKICGEYKANEKFSGKGHAAHICKKCAALPPEERSKQITLTKLENLPWYLTKENITWVRNLRNDKRPEVSAMAREIYNSRFPYAERNERKKQLHVRYMELYVNGEIWDEYGDEISVQAVFSVNSEERTVQIRSDEHTETVTLPQKDMTNLLKTIVNHYEVFCWEEDYVPKKYSDEFEDDEIFDDDFETDDIEEIIGSEETEEIVWRVHVEYKNGEVQDTESSGDIGDRMNDLVVELMAYFEEDDNYRNEDDDE